MTMAERIERTLSVLDDKEECPGCDGMGYVIIEGDDGIGYYAQQATCDECHGEGWVIREPCLVCGAPVNINQPADEQDHDGGCMTAEQEVQA